MKKRRITLEMEIIKSKKTKAQIAKEVGIRPTYLSQLLNGVGTKLDTAIAIRKAIGSKKDLEELFRVEDV